VVVRAAELCSRRIFAPGVQNPSWQSKVVLTAR
jgi:hypothetical protein